MAEISNYDQFGYDYSQYWKNRSYENSAEKHVLNRAFDGKRGKWFLDIGGSFGRLTSTYYDQYSNPIILDYSFETLKKNQSVIKSKYPNVTLIAANAYKMPFQSDSVHGGLMVRVLHHIEKPETYIKELHRVLLDDSTYIQEFANKKHIKAVIRSFLKFDFSIFSKEPYSHNLSENPEGSTEQQEGIFLNYHPKHIKELLEKNNFKIVKKTGCSYLRIPFIKKVFNDEILLVFEKFLQLTLSWSNISPSIFLKTKLRKENTPNKSYKTLEEILACPICKKSLTFEGDKKAKCAKCSKEFYNTDGIWDFRVK